MQFALLTFLKCPLTKEPLRFELINTCQKLYGDKDITEIGEGLLFSETGFIFPVIKGIPRMLVEAVYDEEDFLAKHVRDFYARRAALEKKYPGTIAYCRDKNRRTKKSFAFEWSFLDDKKQDKIWEGSQADLGALFLKETNVSADFFQHKAVLDIGCGHGLMTSAISAFAPMTIGIELSLAVEKAYEKNQQANAWFVQADLQFLPFAQRSFDMLYSSGVIHHTNNTELSLSLIDPLLCPGGRICLWLYHPRKSTFHSFSLQLRKIFSRLPLQLSFILLLIFVFPFSFLYKKIRNNQAPTYREEMIYLLDAFTPEFRYEIPHDTATIWLAKRSYGEINISTQDQFGYAINGIKTK
ncbi:MAG: methyltransferase protein [Ferruginibacter sp.]|nr:methyltransferase protein [Ferruginibacter sp.]